MATYPTPLSGVVTALAGIGEGGTLTLSPNWPLTAGTFTLTFQGQTTSTIAANASAATVQTAIQALSNVGAGNAIVALGPSGDYIITFSGLPGGQGLITGNGASLTPLNDVIAVSIQAGSSATVTINSPATPAVINWTGNGLAAKTPIYFTTTGSLPAPLVANTTYYVTAATSTTLNISATQGGANINTTGSQSGVHTARVDAVQAVSIGANWDSKLAISGKNILLQGSGPSHDKVSSGTKIIGVGSGGTFITYAAIATDNTARISNIWFNHLSALPGNSGLILMNGLSKVHTVGGVAGGGFRIDNCHVTCTHVKLTTGFVTYTNGWLTGVIDHNYIDYDVGVSGGQGEIIENGQSTSPTGTGAYGEASWAHGYTFGSDFTINGDYDAVYYEDNIFHKNGFVVDSSLGGGAYVARHNLSWGSMGSHGMETGNNLGPFAIEWYHNLFVGHAATSYNMHNVRGGGNVCFNTRAIDISKPDIAPGFYRMNSTGSGQVGLADGTNFFDRNFNETIDGSLSTYLNTLPFSIQNGKGWTYTSSFNPSDTRIGSIYFTTSPNNVLTVTLTTGLNTVLVTGGTLSSSDTGRPVVATGVTATVPPTTIAFVDSTHGTLSAVAATGGTGVTMTLGSVLHQGITGQANNNWKIIGLDGTQGADKWQGFMVRNVTIAPDPTLGGQIAGATAPTQSAGYIQHSTSDASSIVTIAPGQSNTSSFTPAPTDTIEIRRIKFPLCVPGSGVMDSLMSGNLKNGPSPSFPTGLPQRWCNQAGQGMWQKDNLSKNTGGSFAPFPLLNTGIYASFIAGGPNDGALPPGYPTTNSTSSADAAKLRIGPSKTDGTLWSVGDAVPSIEYTDVGGATYYGGATYPHPLVSGGAVPNTKVISISPSSLSFGTVAVGTAPTLTINISNTGNSTLTVSGITYPNSVFTDSSTYPFTITSGNSHTVTVTFTPLALTLYQGTATVSSDSTSGVNTFSISGTGFTPSTGIISLSGNMNFGTVQRDSTTTSTLTVNNIGTASFNVTAISDGVGDGVYAFNTTSFTVQPNQPQNVIVTFHPTAVGTYNRTITVTASPITSGTNTIPVNGTAAPKKIYFKYHKA